MALTSKEARVLIVVMPASLLEAPARSWQQNDVALAG
jgi:hypothetical protein